jgi:hypothetical protein
MAPRGKTRQVNAAGINLWIFGEKHVEHLHGSGFAQSGEHQFFLSQESVLLSVHASG